MLKKLNSLNSWKKILLIGSAIMIVTSSLAIFIYFSNDLYAIEMENVQTLIDEGNYSASINKLEELSHFGNKQVILKLAKLYNLTGDYQSTIYLLKKQLGYKNDDRDYMNVLASTYRLKGDFFQEQDLLNTIENKYGVDEELMFKRQVNAEIIKNEKYKYREEENFEQSVNKEKLIEIDFDVNKKFDVYRGDYNRYYATLSFDGGSTFLGQVDLPKVPDLCKISSTEDDKYIMMSYPEGVGRDFLFFRLDKNNIIPLKMSYKESLKVEDSPNLINFSINGLEKFFDFEITDRFSSRKSLELTGVDYNLEYKNEKLLFTIINTYKKGNHTYKVDIVRYYNEKIGKFIIFDLNAQEINV